jgi:hypothetical protein
MKNLINFRRVLATVGLIAIGWGLAEVEIRIILSGMAAIGMAFGLKLKNGQ